MEFCIVHTCRGMQMILMANMAYSINNSIKLYMSYSYRIQCLLIINLVTTEDINNY